MVPINSRKVSVIARWRFKWGGSEIHHYHLILLFIHNLQLCRSLVLFPFNSSFYFSLSLHTHTHTRTCVCQGALHSWVKGNHRLGDHIAHIPALSEDARGGYDEAHVSLMRARACPTTWPSWLSAHNLCSVEVRTVHCVFATLPLFHQR